MGWNVHGIADTEEGESNLKLDEIQAFLCECASRGEKVAAIALQETWLRGDDGIEVDGYVWYGRNRSDARTDPDAPRGSAGVGWLVAEEIVAHALKVTVEKPTFGKCEGLISVTIKRDTTLPREIGA